MAIIDRGYKSFKKAMGDLNGHTVKVGVLSSAGSHMLMIAIANHEGVRVAGRPVIPARRFMQAAMRKARPKLNGKTGFVARTLAAYQQSAINGTANYRVPLSKMGLFLQGEIQQAITDFDTPPNAPSTIAHKGFNNPLIESGRLRQSITYEVK